MFGDLISAGANIIGGFMARDAQKDANAANRAMAIENIKLQKRFAQEGIRWRVEDAKAAGIHPIYALGAQGASFSPVSANFTAESGAAAGMAAAGQDLGRAINSTRTEAERAVAGAQAKLALENMSLQNESLRADIASKNARLVQGSGPPMAGSPYLIPGQTSSGVIENKPLERVAPGLIPSQEPGAITDTGHARTSGGLLPVPSGDMKQRIEDNWYHETMHFIRNNLLPMIAPAFNQPPHAPEKGKAWVYDPVYGYKQVPDRWYRKFIRY